MSRFMLWMAASLIGAVGMVTEAEAARRFAVVVGSNAPVLGRGPLRYAHADAKRLQRALVDLGGFAEQDLRLLLEPRPEEVLATLDALLAKADGPEALLLFFYSGHADATSLYPDGAPLPIAELS